MPHLDPPSAPLESIFASLRGTWTLTRRLTSRLPGFPSGTFTGTATLTPHDSTSAPPDTSTLLYHETGELRTEQGLVLRANRKYIYRLSARDEKMSAWFVKEDAAGAAGKEEGEEGHEEADYLFHELEFSVRDGRWIAKGDHLCDMDMYWAMYDFRLERTAAAGRQHALGRWGLRYQVKGPQKDYSSDTAYERVEAAGV